MSWSSIRRPASSNRERDGSTSIRRSMSLSGRASPRATEPKMRTLDAPCRAAAANMAGRWRKSNSRSSRLRAAERAGGDGPAQRVTGVAVLEPDEQVVKDKRPFPQRLLWRLIIARVATTANGKGEYALPGPFRKDRCIGAECPRRQGA